MAPSPGGPVVSWPLWAVLTEPTTGEEGQVTQSKPTIRLTHMSNLQGGLTSIRPQVCAPFGRCGTVEMSCKMGGADAKWAGSEVFKHCV